MSLNRNELATWRKYFDIDFMEYDVDSYNGEMELIRGTEKFKTMRYPYLAVNQMTTKVLSEPPKIMIGEREVDQLSSLDLREALSSTLGYGEIVVLPFLIEGNLHYNVLPSCDTDFVEQDGELKELRYVRELTRQNPRTKEWEKVIVMCEHILNDNLYEYKEDGAVIFSRRSYNIAPFIVRNQNLTNTGLPMYATATGVIDQLNANDFERAMDRELSRKEVMYPTNMIKKETRRDVNKVGYINHNTRKYRILPGNEDSKPMFLDGQFNPEKYNIDQNQQLHMFSLHCGFGAKYFSYDENQGGLKTATEIVSEKSDLYQSKKMHDKTLKLIIEKIYRAFNILSGSEVEQELTITFSDNIIEDDVSQRAEMKELFELGAIDQRTLLEAYKFSDEKIEQIMASNMEIKEQEGA